jgi:cell fate regulator YaaT (PSP1 superfamily)
MAKDQDLPLNPLKISGACGRLMCCLKYEHPLYQEFHATAPQVGEAVDTPEGAGTVIGHNVPSDTVVVRLTESGQSCRCSKASVCGSRQAFVGARADGAMRETADAVSTAEPVDLDGGEP